MEKEEKNFDEEKLKEKAREISIKEGSAYSISEGVGIRYITPYALALGASNIIIALLSSLPSLFGNLSQLLTPKFMEKTSRKKIAFSGAFLQALMWLPMIFLGVLFFVFKIKVALALVFVYTLLVLFGSFYGPAWNSWMKELVSEKTGKFFGKRNLICGAVALASMFIAGFILDYFKKINILFGFALIFGIAFVARLTSALLFTKKYEPKLKLEKGYYFTFFQFLKKMHGNNFGRFVIFVALMQLATAIASPFFAVYMLKELKFSYLFYTLVIMSSSLATLLFMPFWGNFVDKYGNLKALRICGSFIPLIPLLWFSSFLFHKNIVLLSYLIFVELSSGILWGGFNLAAGNFIFDAVTKQRMALCVAYYNILAGAGVFIGAQIGGFLSISGIILLNSAFLFIFLLSSVIRFVVFLLMVRKINEVRVVKRFDKRGMKELFLEQFSIKK